MTEAAPRARLAAPAAVLSPAVLQRARAAAPAAAQPEISANPVFQIMMNEALDPEAKRDAVAKFLTVAETKEEILTRTRIHV